MNPKAPADRKAFVHGAYARGRFGGRAMYRPFETDVARVSCSWKFPRTIHLIYIYRDFFPKKIHDSSTRPSVNKYPYCEKMGGCTHPLYQI